MGSESLAVPTDCSGAVIGRAIDAGREMAEGRINEIDSLIQSLRDRGYSPEQIRQMAELISERDGLIQQLFESNPPVG